MTTTQPSSQPSILAKDISASPKIGRLRLNSIGTQLFIYVLSGTAIGLGILSYFFYLTFKNGVEEKIQERLNIEVTAIDVQLTDVERAALSVGMAARSLHRVGVRDPEVYNNLMFREFFREQRPSLVMAIGLGQAPNTLVSSLKWYHPYFYLDQGVPNSPGVNLPAPDSKFKYAELFKSDNYPEKEYWLLPTRSGKPVWTTPYDWYGITMTSYQLPFYDDQGKLLGISGFDVNVTKIGEAIKKSVFGNAGYFAILDDKGTVVAYSPDPKLAKALKSYKDVPGLTPVWSQAQQGQSGLLSIDGNYWAYRRIPGINWLMLAQVPQSVVLTPVIQSTVSASLGVTVLLGIIVILFVRRLNTRLRPILAECHKLAVADAQTQELLMNQDEIGRLSTSFFNLLHMVATNEEQLRQEVARTQQAQEQAQQQANQIEADNEVLQNDVSQLLDTVSAVEEGDLTVQAPVSDRVTGLVADTFNRLLEQLSSVMAQVLGTAQQVTHGSLMLEELAKTVAANAQEQAHSVTQVLSLTEQVEQKAQDSAQKAHHASKSLENVQDAVTHGQAAINTLIQGIAVLQQGNERIVQQMKALGEFVGLADSFVQEQGRIASLTQVLTMNATIVAARAAEQRDPRQFSVVAREFEAIANQVGTLAQQTNGSLEALQQRTEQIHMVVSAIDVDVQGLSGLVNEFTQGVEQSSYVFNNVRAVTGEVVQAGAAVAQSNSEIASAAQSTATAMRGIADLAAQTAQLTQNTRLQSEQMEALSAQLLQRVQFFQLPAAVQQEDPELINHA